MTDAADPAAPPAGAVATKAQERRAIGVASGAHALHDGYTDLIYVMLPIWQAEFGLGYAALGIQNLPKRQKLRNLLSLRRTPSPLSPQTWLPGGAQQSGAPLPSISISFIFSVNDNSTIISAP